MDKSIRTKTDSQNVQQSRDGSYLLKVNDTAVVVRFNGSNSLSTQLASVFGSMIE